MANAKQYTQLNKRLDNSAEQESSRRDKISYPMTGRFGQKQYK
jgi:hypothetical protein